MKKIIITSLVAVALILGSAANAQAAFTTYLTVGSTGADVVALQTWLLSNGFVIPALSSGAASKGYFGQQTKAAVVKYQASVGLPATGFVGPLTIAKLNAGVTSGSVVMSPVACPAGYVCTPAAGTVVTGPTAVSGTITTPGVAGTLAVSLQGSPSGASLDKGEAEDVARYKLQAAASDMQVTSVALDFSTRLWLYASSVTIKDDAGAIIAQKNNLSANDFTELTTGSDYRLYIPVNYVVPRTQTRYFVVNVAILPISDRDSETITINDIQVRSVDGTGVTDTQGSDVGDRTFSYTGTNTGQVVITLNDQAPPNMLVPISTSNETDNVVMGVANFKSQNKSGTLRSLSLYVMTNGIVAPAALFSDVKIKSGDLVYSADSIGNGNLGALTTFTDMNIPLPKDQNVPIAILVKVKQSTNNALDGSKASSTLLAAGTAGGASNNPVVEDSNYNTIDINDAPIATSDITFSESDAHLFAGAPTAVLGSAVQSDNVTVAQAVSFTATITAGVNTLYISADPVVALSTTSTGYGATENASTTLTQVSASPSEIAGDSTGAYYVIPAGGSRTFTWSGTVRNDAPRGVTTRSFSISGIKYGTSSSALGANTIVYYNYGALKVIPVI